MITHSDRPHHPSCPRRQCRPCHRPRRPPAAARHPAMVQAGIVPAVARTRRRAAATDPFAHLPSTIARARQELEAREQELAAASAANLTARPDPTEGRAADVRLDSAWGALDLATGAWARIPSDADASTAARKLREILFGHGLKFTLEPWELEWAESDLRLRRMQEDDVQQALAQLPGLAPFVAALKRAQTDYGPAIGLTVPGQVAPTPPSLREPLANLSAAIRSYVLQVTAHGDAAHSDEAQTMAQHLLQGLATWEGRSSSAASRAAGAASTPDPAPSPTSPDAAGTAVPLVARSPQRLTSLQETRSEPGETTCGSGPRGRNCSDPPWTRGGRGPDLDSSTSGTPRRGFAARRDAFLRLKGRFRPRPTDPGVDHARSGPRHRGSRVGRARSGPHQTCPVHDSSTRFVRRSREGPARPAGRQAGDGPEWPGLRRWRRSPSWGSPSCSRRNRQRVLHDEE